MLTIAISGANGFVGQKLSKILLADSSNNLIKIGRNNNEGYKNFVDIETSQTKDISRQLAHVDCLIHLAARAHTKNATLIDFQRDNIDLSRKLATIAADANIKQFIYLSSIKVHGNTTEYGKPFKATDQPKPVDLYGKSKLESEILIKGILHGTNSSYTIIRSPLVWGDKCKGNLKTLINLIDRGVPIPFGAIRNRRDIISIENLCDFIIHTILHPNAVNQIFLVSDGKTRSTKEIITLLEAFAEKKAFFANTPNMLFEALKFFPVFKPKIESFFDNLEIDINETKRILSWTPTK
jgi:UDP-glucose 4-epimerase